MKYMGPLPMTGAKELAGMASKVRTKSTVWLGSWDKVKEVTHIGVRSVTHRRTNQTRKYVKNNGIQVFQS